jgi:biopolymer transport protein ExbB
MRAENSRGDHVVQMSYIDHDPDSPVAILNYDRPKAEIKEMIEDHGCQEVPLLERYLGFLGTIASISPFLGLLGTVVGLLKVFEAIAQAGGITNAAILSEGIHNALITTVAGLCVAIPSLVAYNYLTRKVEGLVLEVERVSLRLLNILKRLTYLCNSPLVDLGVLALT